MESLNNISRESTNMESVSVSESHVSVKGVESKPTPIFGFIFFGIVGLLCFNFFLQVLAYLDTCFSKSFSEYANILYGLSNNCGQLLIIFYGSKIAFSSRIYYSAIGLAVVLIAFPVLSFITTDTTVGMTLGLLLTFGLGLFNAVIQSAGFGLAGICSSKSMEFFSVGQALSGLLGWPLSLLLNFIFSSAGYSTQSTTTGRPSQVDVAATVTSLSLAAVVTILFVPYYRFVLSKTPMVEGALKDLSTLNESSLVQHRSKINIIKDALPLAMAVWFVMFVTFVVFPSQLFAWTPSYGPYPTEFFYPCMMIYMFQVFDVVGRYAVSFLKLTPTRTKIASLSRGAILPFFYLATYNVWIFSNDITKILIMAVFAATNGFILTWCMIHGPSQVHKDERDVASYTMSFFLVNGIFFGSLASMAIGKILAATGA